MTKKPGTAGKKKKDAPLVNLKKEMAEIVHLTNDLILRDMAEKLNDPDTTDDR